MTPSPQQLAIYSWLTEGSGHASIRACAGSGKTTTLVGLCSRISPSWRSVFLAFNKSIAEELKTRLPFYVHASTFHSYCFDTIKSAFPRIRVDDRKVKWHLKDLLPDWNDRRHVEPEVLALVSYAKSSGYACEACAEVPSLSDLADYYNLDASTQVVRLAETLLEQSATDTTRLDFDDMLWLPLRHNLCFNTKANYLMVDEAQDTNIVQCALLDRMLAPSGRLIIVGDRNQAIYGFRGAGTNAMDELEKRFNMTQLPLSVSYRCSQKVVEEAQRVLAKPVKKRARYSPEDLTARYSDVDELRFEQEPL